MLDYSTKTKDKTLVHKDGKSDEKKTQIKNLFRMCCFLIVVLVYLFGLGEWFRPEGSSFDSYYGQPENTIDVIMVGSSHVYSGYAPAVLWREYGISSYNIYAWSQSIPTAYYYTMEALQTQDIEMVFLDVGNTALGAYGEDTTEADYLNLFQNINFKTTFNRYRLLMESSEIGDEDVGFGGVNDLTLYHEKWKFPELLFTPYEYNEEAKPLRNFGALFPQVENEVFNYSFYKESAEPTTEVQKYLDKFIKLSEQENFKLVFILTPFAASKEQMAVFNWVHGYAEQNSIDFIDFFREAGNESGINFFDDMADADHVRYTGAVKLTRYIGDYLQKSGYQPKTNTNAEQLDSDAELVYRMLEEMYNEDIENGQIPSDGETYDE